MERLLAKTFSPFDQRFRGSFEMAIESAAGRDPREMAAL